MAELKTKLNDASVDAFIQSISDEDRRQDCQKMMQMMADITGQEARMWGDAIVGFGMMKYRYSNGRENDWFKVGFSPRKQNLTLYLMVGLEHLAPWLERLGKHKTGNSCLYIKKLSDVNADTLADMIREGYTAKSPYEH